ncbi:hypothetical protein ACFY12_25885 [Streptomyces sp. NPDC001339]|uniref:hypothetical protein n=1 Tax=Streptomyces sp. NPDC001339 TaxID=3364563 RepID=UPI0036A44AA9
MTNDHGTPRPLRAGDTVYDARRKRRAIYCATELDGSYLLADPQGFIRPWHALPGSVEPIITDEEGLTK